MRADPTSLKIKDLNLYDYGINNPINFADQYGLFGYSGSLWTDLKIFGQVFWEDIYSGTARRRILDAASAELSIAAGIGELVLTVRTGGVAGAFIAIHALGNIAGGLGRYLDIFDSDICEDRDWNLTRQGYESLFALTGGNPNWGTKAFYLTDAAIGVGGMLQGVPAYQKLGFGVERYYTTPAFVKASRLVVAHDVLQISTSIKSSMNK